MCVHGYRRRLFVDSLDPHERVVELRVNALQVLNGQLLPQHLLVERHAETVVYELPVVQSLRRIVERRRRGGGEGRLGREKE